MSAGPIFPAATASFTTHIQPGIPLEPMTWVGMRGRSVYVYIHRLLVRDA